MSEVKYQMIVTVVPRFAWTWFNIFRKGAGFFHSLFVGERERELGQQIGTDY
jgi:hypothetical protein